MPCYVLGVGGIHDLTKKSKWQCIMRHDLWGNNYTHEPLFFFSPQKKRKLICTLISIRRKTSVKAFPNMLCVRTKKSLEKTWKKREEGYCNCNWELRRRLTIFNIRWQCCSWYCSKPSLSKNCDLSKSGENGLLPFFFFFFKSNILPKFSD